MTRVLKPLPAAIIGLVLSLLVGIAVTWRSMNLLVNGAIALRAEEHAGKIKRHGWDFWTVEMSNLASELKGERAVYQKREEQLDLREARIVAGEKELARTRASIDALRKEISDRVIEMKADEEVNLRKLAQTYSNLSPTAVVAIIRELDDRTAVKILSLMKPDVVGPIFEEMSKTAGTDGTLARRAAMLSEQMRLMKVTPTPAPTSP